MSMPVIYYGEKLLDFEWSSFPFDYQAFLSSMYCDRLRHFFRLVEVDARLDSFFHGISHTERVAFYAAIMAWRHGIDETLTDIVILAGLLHDVGRTDDGPDPEHGARSAEVLRGGGYERLVSGLSPEHFNILLAIIENHTRLADGGLAETRKRYNLSFSGFYCFTICLCILKEADGLDLIRINSKAKRFLSVEYGKPLEFFSKEVFNKYWTPPKGDIYFHLTTEDRVQSILNTGLKLSYYASAGDYKPVVYFAGNSDDCIQLAAPTEGYFGAREFTNRWQTFCRRTNCSYSLLSSRVAIFSVDLSGLTDKLMIRCSRRHDEKYFHKRWEGIYEYCLPVDVPPQRIIGVEYVTLTVEAPEPFIEPIQDLLR